MKKASTPFLSDGNGIIIDSNEVTNYKGKTLVANNLSYNNGGAGIHEVDSSYVDFINNTTSNNGLVPSENYPEIFAVRGSHINYYNNIAYPNGAATPNKAFSMNSTTNVAYDYNVLNGVVDGAAAPTPNHNLYVNPLFKNRAGYDFRLDSNSPARDSGTSSFAQATDNQLNARPQGTGYDRGAFEFVTSAQLSRTGWTASAFATRNTLVPAYAIDGSTTSYWSSGTNMAIGQTFTLDLGQSQLVGRVSFGSDTSGVNFPSGVDIFVSNNITEIGYPMKSLKNNTNPTIDLSFVTRTGRYVTFKINTAKTAWWTINEINLYTQ